MKTFKDYIKPNNPFLGWKSSFAENRHLLKKRVSEEITKEPVRPNYDNYEFHNDKYHPIHDTLAIKGREELSPEEIEAVKHYTGTSSRDRVHGHKSSPSMNGYLRNRFGSKFSTIPHERNPNNPQNTGHNESEKTKAAIGTLSKAFRPSTTNSVPIETYSGIPEEYGQKLGQMKEGETTHLPGWTSTSTNPTVAPQYATKDLYGGKQHLIKFHVHPGAGLSVARHSSYVNSGSDDPYNTGNGSRGEDEILLHHGTEVTKVKTETDERGNFIHHFEAHPRHLPLDQYPKEYQNPHF